MRKLAMAALIFGVTISAAQNEKKTATVRIKKVENINGVEKVTDTTYTTNDPSSIKMDGGNIQIKEVKDGKGAKKTVIMNVESDGSGKSMSDAEIQKTIDAFTTDDPKSMDGKTVIVKKVGKCDATKEEIDGAKEEIQVTIIRRVDVKDASAEDMKRLSKQTGTVDHQLQMDKMNMSPNPSNGKFNLNFNLKEKGDVDINVFSMDGKEIYNEKLSDFQGEYKKSIDLSENNKGIYFMKIQQGTHSEVKKIVID